MAYQGRYISDSDVDNWPSDADDDYKQAVITRVERLIENVCNDIFYENPFEIKISGNGKSWINLGLKYNVLLVNEVKVWGSVLSKDLYSYNSYALYLNQETDRADLAFTIIGDEVLFPRGRYNIEVAGTYGKLETPYGVMEAAKILARAENDSTLYTQYSDFQQLKLGDYSFKRDKKVLTGIVEADRWLRPYIRKKTKMGAV